MDLGQTYSSRELYIEVVSGLIPLYGESEARQLGKLLLESYGIAFEKIMIDEPVFFSANSKSDLDTRVDMLHHDVPIQYVMGKAYFLDVNFWSIHRCSSPGKKPKNW
ncbi:MAG: hypothetical protein HC819_06000 [Cyclobacteriaceae bacterium]|nr:hypothetical protein [Cyclobacteriaceae bacterium]